MKVTIGADPEFFVSIKGELVSAHGLVGGTKEAPLPVDKGAVQVDGMALEFNIDPSDKLQDFSYNIHTVLKGMRKLIPEEYDFEFKPTAEFGKEYIDKQPEKAKELGCEPDYCAYSGKVNEKPDGDLGFRTAAGHVHIGIDRDLDEMEERKLVILCDLLIGVPSLLRDSDNKRRELYGKAGCYRSKPYGVEYRTLSNFWLSRDDDQAFIFNRAVKAAELLDKFEEVVGGWENSLVLSYTDVEDIINKSKTSDALRTEFFLRENGYV